MDDHGKPVLWRLVCVSLVVGALADGCTSSTSNRREDGSRDGEAAAQQLQVDERDYRDAAEQFLKYLDEQRKAGTDIVQASGGDGIYPEYRCMEHGCPDKVLCEEANVYCHITHCGQKGCSFCPKAMPDFFKNLVLKQWCVYECQRGPVRAGSALGLIPSVGTVFVGPYCFND